MMPHSWSHRQRCAVIWRSARLRCEPRAGLELMVHGAASQVQQSTCASFGLRRLYGNALSAGTHVCIASIECEEGPLALTGMARP